jgi:hypothetical protein
MDDTTVHRPTTTEAIADLGYAVGALVNSVQHLSRAVHVLVDAGQNGGVTSPETMVECQAALAEAKRTSDASIMAVVGVLRGFGERSPNERR